MFWFIFDRWWRWWWWRRGRRWRGWGWWRWRHFVWIVTFTCYLSFCYWKCIMLKVVGLLFTLLSIYCFNFRGRWWWRWFGWRGRFERGWGWRGCRGRRYVYKLCIHFVCSSLTVLALKLLVVVVIVVQAVTGVQFIWKNMKELFIPLPHNQMCDMAGFRWMGEETFFCCLEMPLKDFCTCKQE